MSNGLHGPYHQLIRRWAAILVVAITVLLVPCCTHSQTPSSGALTGVTVDPTGAALPDVFVRLANRDTATTRLAPADKEGRFGFLLLPPGWYEIHAFRAEFYNALNHPQFSNPDLNFTSATFGVISSTAVNPRVTQLALKLMF